MYEKHRGTIKSFIQKKYGFIKPEANGTRSKDIFFGKENIKDNTKPEQLTQGTKVLFHTQIVNERKRAVKVEIAK